MDIKALMKYREIWNQFTARHPKFFAFLQTVKNRELPEGTIAEIVMKYPDGSTMKTNIQLTKEDIEILDMLDR